MPVSRAAQALYPGGSLRSPEWLAIRKTILARSGGRCECRGECGVDQCREHVRCEARNARAHPDTGSRVVLTIAHLDHDPANNDADNLKALCQRCHNALDAPMRRAHAAETRRRARAAGDLFEGPYHEPQREVS